MESLTNNSRFYVVNWRMRRQLTHTVFYIFSLNKFIDTRPYVISAR